MVDHLLDDLVWHGGNVCTGQSTLGHMHRMAHAGGDDFGVDAIRERKDVGDVANEKGADEGTPDFF